MQFGRPSRRGGPTASQEPTCPALGPRTPQKNRVSGFGFGDRCFRQLNDAERQVLRQLLDGNTNRLIAQEPGINVRTVENRRARVKIQRQVRSRVELLGLVYAHAAARICWLLTRDRGIVRGDGSRSPGRGRVRIGRRG